MSAVGEREYNTRIWDLIPSPAGVCGGRGGPAEREKPVFVFGVVTLFAGLAAPEAQPPAARYVEERVVVYKEYDGKQLRMTLFGAGPVNGGPPRTAVRLVHGAAWR